MKLALEIWDVLILIGSVQGFVLSTFIAFSKKHPPAKYWLAGLVFLLSLAGLGLVLSYGGVAARNLWLHYIPFIIQMALGPLLYLYVRGLLFPERRFSGRDWFHLAPALFDLRYTVILVLFRFGWIPRSTATAWFDFPTSYTDALAWVWFAVYLWMAYRLVRRVQRHSDELPKEQLQLGWLNRLLKAFFVLALFWAGYVTVELSPLEQTWSYWQDYLIYVPLSIMIYWLGFAGYLKPEIVRVEVTSSAPKTAPATSELTPEEFADYAGRLRQAMEVAQLYLNPLLSVAQLAEHTALSQKTVSSFLNQHLQKSFNEFVNEYRVEEVKKRLREPANQHLTLSGIALDSGFNSQATFQRTFKQVTGMSPRQFLAGQLAD